MKIDRDALILWLLWSAAFLVFLLLSALFVHDLTAVLL